VFVLCLRHGGSSARRIGGLDCYWSICKVYVVFFNRCDTVAGY